MAFKTELAARAERQKPVERPTPATETHASAPRFRLWWLLVPVVLAPLITGIVTLGKRVESQTLAVSEAAPEVEAGAPAATTSPATSESSVTINSHPAGATVVIDGKPRGVTPLKLTLPIGRHRVELRKGAASRALPLDVEANTATTQYIELQSGPAAPEGFGVLDVQSTPPGARILVDGTFRGVTPMTIRDLGVGSHQVTLTSQNSSFNRVVTIAPGATSSVVASLAPTAVAVGWVVFESPLDVQVFENGRRLGSGLDRIMVPAGTHTLELVNDQYRYRTTASVDVTAGETTHTRIDVPLGRISVNATPWAEVLIDGRSAGTTPLAYINVPIGLHEIVWRHPQFGERREVVSVTAEQPVRIGMDFNR
jgi:hypothetical protein